MKRNIICILIALAALSSCAYLIGDQPWQEIADFQSTFNKVPISVLLYRPGHDIDFEAMDIQELRKYSEVYDKQFVRFTGRVNFDFTDAREKQRQRIELGGYPAIDVYPLKLQNPLETYERGKTYQFTGFLVQYEEHEPNQPRGKTKLRLYAFDIQPLAEEQEAD